MKISISKDFNKYPAGRFIADGEYSGERFRKEFLVPNLRTGDIVEIDLNDLGGVGSSFWDEAFACLILKEGFLYEEIKSKLILKCDDDITLCPLIWKYIDEAKEMIK